MIIYCDGGSRGNPGNSASAIVVTADEKVVYKESKFLGTNTNNVAEYNAVLLAVNYLINNKINTEVVVNLDSQLVERQLNGFYKVKDLKLKELFDNIKNNVSKNNLKIKFVWGYRSKNKLADELVNVELDKQSLAN